MKLSRIKRRLVTFSGLTALAAGSLLSGLLLFETPASKRAREAAPATGAPTAVASVGSRSGGPVSLTDLTTRLGKTRRDDSVRARRERTFLLNEIGKLKTKDSRAYLLELAKRENAEPVERLAAVAALANVGDSRALDTIAASTSDALVHAKIKVVRELKPGGGRS